MRLRDEQLIVSYLLGEVSESEQEQIESDYFQDRDFHLLILALEEELIIDYLRGKLTAREVERFEDYFLSSSRRRAKYQSIQNLLNDVDALPAAAAARS